MWIIAERPVLRDGWTAAGEFAANSPLEECGFQFP
jgi:hypothetical protein